MKIQAQYLEKGMRIIFKNQVYTICDIIQCGTTKTSVYVNNNYDEYFRRFLNEQEVEIL